MYPRIEMNTMTEPLKTLPSDSQLEKLCTVWSKTTGKKLGLDLGLYQHTQEILSEYAAPAYAEVERLKFENELLTKKLAVAIEALTQYSNIDYHGEIDLAQCTIEQIERMK